MRGDYRSKSELTNGESIKAFWKKQRKQILKGLKRTSAIGLDQGKIIENKLMSVRCIRSGARYLFWWPGKMKA